MKHYPGYERSPHYYETDQMGIIHHANYIRWFEEARVDLLDFLQLPYQTIEAAGIIVPVLAVNARYKEMIRYGDNVRIAVFVTAYTGTRLNFRYEIYKENQVHPATLGSSEHCFIQQDTGRLIQLKKTHPAIHEIFVSYSQLDEPTS